MSTEAINAVPLAIVGGLLLGVIVFVRDLIEDAWKAVRRRWFS